MQTYIFYGIGAALALVIAAILGHQLGVVTGSNEQLVEVIQARLTNDQLHYEIGRVRAQRDNCLKERGNN